MVIRIKDKKLHTQIYKKMNAYDDKAMAEYSKGNMQKGELYEKKSDALYDKNYSKMWEVVPEQKVKR